MNNAKSAIPDALVTELMAASSAYLYGFDKASYVELLCTVLDKAAQANPAAFSGTGGNAGEQYLRGLRLEELALARGCAAGNERAWEEFLTRFRVKLYDAARGITKEDSSARELADSIYADLYGEENEAGVRVSKLNSYGGRGSLEGWLRTVLAQEWVNRYRKSKRLVSLEEEEAAGAQFAAPASTEADCLADSGALGSATDAALASLENEDRYILAAYYLDKRTLAEIAKSLGVHESTISRKVEKIGNEVRKQILGRLIQTGMSKRQAEEALEVDVRDVAVDVRNRLEAQATDQNLAGQKNSPRKTKKAQESATGPF